MTRLFATVMLQNDPELLKNRLIESEDMEFIEAPSKMLWQRLAARQPAVPAEAASSTAEASWGSTACLTAEFVTTFSYSSPHPVCYNIRQCACFRKRYFLVSHHLQCRCGTHAGRRVLLVLPPAQGGRARKTAMLRGWF